MHPRVVDTGGWNGYRYWMAMTPFTGSNAVVENPCILASNDGSTWVVPDGLTNPIDPNPGGGKNNSDADLILGQDGKLWCFWREFSPVVIYASSSSDGITWSAPQSVLSGVDVTSPSVLWDGSQYVMYCVEGTITKRTCATPNGTWSGSTACPFVGLTMPAGKELWHISIDKVGEQYRGLITVTDSATQTEFWLYYACSDDGINFKLAQFPILSASVSGWDDGGIYRSCGLWSGDVCTLYYSAFSGTTWHIGLSSFEYNP